MNTHTHADRHTPWHSVWGSGRGWGCWCRRTAPAGCRLPWRWAPPSCTRHRRCTGSRRHTADCAPAESNTNQSRAWAGFHKAVTQATPSEDSEGRPAFPHLKLGGDEHGGGADELQHLPVDGGLRQVVVRDLHGQVEGLVVQLEVLLQETDETRSQWDEETPKTRNVHLLLQENPPAPPPASRSGSPSSRGWGWAAWSCSYRGQTSPADDRRQ